MANRHTLHINQLDYFSIWLENQGWQIQPVKGSYEVLRAKKKGRQYPLIIYKKMDAKEHLSVLDRDIRVLASFIRASKEKDHMI